MAKHRTHSLEFKRQVAQEFLAGETLHSLAKRYDLSRNLIRIWVQRFEAGALDEDAVAADLIQQYEARIAAVEPQRATVRSTTRADIRDSGVQDGHGPDARVGSSEKAVPAGQRRCGEWEESGLGRWQLRAAVIVAAMGVLGGIAARADSARHFSFAYDQPHSTGYGIAADLFNSKLMEMSHGSMAIDQFPGAQLGQ